VDSHNLKCNSCSLNLKMAKMKTTPRREVNLKSRPVLRHSFHDVEAQLRLERQRRSTNHCAERQRLLDAVQRQWREAERQRLQEEEDQQRRAADLQRLQKEEEEDEEERQRLLDEVEAQQWIVAERQRLQDEEAEDEEERQRLLDKEAERERVEDKAQAARRFRTDTRTFGLARNYFRSAFQPVYPSPDDSLGDYDEE
jgi:hypothetical protein